MRLLIIRHAIAEERLTSQEGDDAARALTRKGRRRMRRAARGIASVCGQIDLLVSSPLVRAVQTARIVHRAYGKRPKRKRLDLLAPGGSGAQLMRWLKRLGRQKPGQTVALVGHEPDLSRLVGYLLTGKGRCIVRLKKGAACLLELSQEDRQDGATLLWAMKPGQLRRLA